MGGIVNLQRILEALDPELREGELVFLTLPADAYGSRPDLKPVAAITEDEGLTLVVPRSEADAAGLAYDGVFRRITLNVRSSLSAVGLTAAVADALARKGIGANILAAYHHDHVLVPAERAGEAVAALRSLIWTVPDATE